MGRFSRSTIVAACEAVGSHGHDKIDSVILALGVPGVPKGKGASTGLTTKNKAHLLAAYILDDPRSAGERDSMIDTVIEEAIKRGYSDGGAFRRALERDGYSVTDDDQLRRHIPVMADLPAADDEVHSLLEQLGMTTAAGHLKLAEKHHSAGEWSSANGELRKLLQSVLDGIAAKLAPDEAAKVQPGPNMRVVLATKVDPPFLRKDVGEWTENGKNFVEGVFKRLNEGSHPGLSEQDECTFRLHLVLVVARDFLRRAKERLIKG